MKSCYENIQIGDTVGVSFFIDIFNNSLIWSKKIDNHYKEFVIVSKGMVRNKGWWSIGSNVKYSNFAGPYNQYLTPYFMNIYDDSYILKVIKKK